MQPVIIVQNDGILEFETELFFRASGQNFPPITFKSNITISSETANAPRFVIRSLSWRDSVIFLECQFLSLSTGKYVYVMHFSQASGIFSVVFDISIV